VAEMIPDGATIQLGVGGSPTAWRPTPGHKDLASHGDVLPGDGRPDREGGGEREQEDHPPRKTFSPLPGNKRLFDFLDDNPAVESLPRLACQRPRRHRPKRHHDLRQLRIEMDLTGQCNAEYLDGSQFSGTGGSSTSCGEPSTPGGKSILAFYATAKDGAVSRVVPRLKSGTVVTTPRMDTTTWPRNTAS